MCSVQALKYEINSTSTFFLEFPFICIHQQIRVSLPSTSARKHKAKSPLSNHANLINLSLGPAKKPKQDASITSHHPLISEVINEPCLNFSLNNHRNGWGEKILYDKCDFLSFCARKFSSYLRTHLFVKKLLRDCD